MKTEIYQCGPARFDMTGKLLPTHLSKTKEVISPGLANRIKQYADRRLEEDGFLPAAKDWEVSVYTIDAELKSADRRYCVKYLNEKGGYIELVHILTKDGWPFLDHNYEIGVEQ